MSEPAKHWGKWRGVSCAHDGCSEGARAKGYCPSHYNKTRWADGVRPPSVNPQSRREAHLRHRYGISLAEYDQRLADQKGLCAVCQRPPDKNVRAHWGGKLCVDHCHGTGKVRGLLCNDCNLAVGYGKTEEVLLAAARYVKEQS